MGAMTSQITSLTIVYSTAYSGTDQRKHQSSALQAFVWGPFDDVIMAKENPYLAPCYWAVHCEKFGENWQNTIYSYKRVALQHCPIKRKAAHSIAMIKSKPRTRIVLMTTAFILTSCSKYSVLTVNVYLSVYCIGLCHNINNLFHIIYLTPKCHIILT